MHQQYKTFILDEPIAHVLRITLNRPDTANAINTAMIRELCDFWAACYTEVAPNWRCIVLRGSGHTFCAGADLKERNTMSDSEWLTQHAIFEQAFTHMMQCPLPILAAVNGAAFGGGLELLLASDFVYAVSSATFSFPEVKRGIIPGAYGTQNLPRACGARRAKEIILTGQSFTAAEAHRWNIVNQLFDTETQLMEGVLNTARQIAANAPLAIRQAKKSLNVALQSSLQTGYMFEIEAYNRLIATDDRREGVMAFNEKREPSFVGK